MPQYYGVWIGREPGIYDNWDDCKKQVDKFSGAKFQKLKSTEYKAAVEEYNQKKKLDYPKIDYVGNTSNAESVSTVAKTVSKVGSSTVSSKASDSPSSQFNDKKPIENILTVDGASNGRNCEFRAVWYPSGEEVFASKKYEGGTNNIAEFLGLVFALKYLIKNKLPLKVYSDSVTAMAWYREKKANTSANQSGKATDELNKLLEDAENFLKINTGVLNGAHVMKWHTAKWDFAEFRIMR